MDEEIVNRLLSSSTMLLGVVQGYIQRFYSAVQYCKEIRILVGSQKLLDSRYCYCLELLISDGRTFLVLIGTNCTLC